MNHVEVISMSLIDYPTLSQTLNVALLAARYGQRWPSSGTGSALDLVAPGWNVSTVAYNSDVSGSSFRFTGCSAATPVAAGVATLLLSIDPLPTHAQITDILTSTAADQVGLLHEDLPGRDDFMGHGLLDMHAALASIAPAPAPVVPSVSLQGRALAAVLVGLIAARRARSSTHCALPVNRRGR